MSVTWLQLRQPESFQTLAGLLLETEWFPVENHCSVLWLLVTQLYVTLCDPMDYSLPGSSIHVIFQARILEQLAIILLWGIFQPFFFFFSTVSIYWEKVFLKILRDSVQMQCPLKTSLDFLICTQIIPWLLMETWEESVVLSTLFLFHPAFPPNSIPHLSSRKSVSGQQALFVSNMVPVATTIKFPGIGRFTFGDRMIWKLRTTVLNIF